jgi:hypothetical protein
MRSFKSILPVAIALGCAACGYAAEPFLHSSATPLSASRGGSAPGAFAPRAGIAANALIPAPALAAAPVVVPREEAALAILERRVAKQSHPEALRIAFEAYWRFRAAHPEQVKKPYLYFVDFGLDSREPRGYVFDMDALEVVEGPFTVAHGRGSAPSRDGVPTRFTNIQNSATTSLGLYVAQETYAFSGTSAGRRYRSIGLRLRGFSGNFNSAARRRGIVVHGAPYVTPSKAGRSEGCPAMEPSRAERLIPLIANGGVVFHFSSLDARWMREDPWISGSGNRMASTSDARNAG